METASSAGSDALSRTHPAGILVRAADGVRQAVLGLVAVAFGSLQGDAPGWVFALGGVAIIATVIAGAWLGWRQLRYRAGLDDIRVERGIINKEARSVPYDRIQDVGLSESLLARAFGLVEVQFETGAGGKEELKLAYVTRAEGEKLRELVRDRRDEAAAVIAPASEAEAEEEDGVTIFAMDRQRLLTFGAFEFSLLVFAIVGTTAQQFDFLLPSGVLTADFWEAQFDTQEQFAQGLGWGARLGAVVIALATLLFIGFATGMIRTILRDYDFRLDRTAKGFRRRRGLLTRTDVVMPIHRVQAATIGTGVIRRLFGWHTLSFVSLASDNEQASHTAAPFATMTEIARIADVAGIALPDRQTVWQRPDARYFIDSALLFAGPMLIVATGLALSPYRAFALIPLALVVLVASLKFLQWHRHRHALDRDTLYAQVGIFSPELIGAPRFRFHSVEISQGPIARLRGYAALHFGLAGGGFAVAGVPVDEARRVRANVLNSIAAVDFAELPR